MIVLCTSASDAIYANI